MKQLTHTDHPDYSDHPPAPDTEPNVSSIGTGFRGWLKSFALYLSAVIAAGLIGLFFFWQLPLPNDLTTLVSDTDYAPRYRSRLATTTPIIATTPESPTATNAASEQSLDSTDTTTALSTAESQDDPNTTAPDASTEAADTVAETSSEEPPPLTAEAEIEQLLVEARQQMDNRRITAPASGNALRTYQRVLELQPDHPVAIQGIQRIAAYYWDVAEQRFRQGRLDEGLSYINRGLRAAPNNRALLNLRQEIQITQRRQQEERALRLELERQWAVEQARQEQIRRERQTTQQPWWQQAPQHSINQGFNQR